ncbi:MAG: beta-ketoacyl synthase chain length factor [Pseudomonadota bacterium]
MSLKFSLDAWSAWAPDKTRASDWQAWALGQSFQTEPGPPDISSVPAMQRRRMSSLSKMAIATAATAAASSSVKPCCIFASRHGELGRTVKIMESIVKQEDVSPTDFSLSVFNTALGLYSIVSENKAPSTMVVGGEDTFGSALIESMTYLRRFPEVPVLLVYFDEPLPAPLNIMEDPPGPVFSLALLLSAGTPNVDVNFAFNDGKVSEDRNMGLEFLKFYLSGMAEGHVTTERTRWHWSRL